MTVQSTTLLSYAINPTPNPLQASPTSDDPNMASLQFVVSNSTSANITVRSIAFTLPVGSNPKDLTNDASEIHTSVQAGWQLTQVKGQFLLKPTGSGILGRDSVSFELTDIPVNLSPGTFAIAIVEETGTDTVNHGSLALAKFPNNFAVSDLVATPPIINVGETATLSWSGSEGGTYTLEYDQNSQSVPHTGTFPISDLQETTSIYLEVVSGSGETKVSLQRSVTVTVNRVQILSFDAAPLTVYPNGLVKLSWVAENATSCSLPYTDNASFPSIGEAFFILQETQTFTLIANGSNGTTDQRQFMVNVTTAPPPKPKVSFVTTGPDGGQGTEGSPGPAGVQHGLTAPGGQGGQGGRGGEGVMASPMKIEEGNWPTLPETFSADTAVYLLEAKGGHGGKGGPGGPGGPGTSQGLGGQGGLGGPGGAGGTIEFLLPTSSATTAQFIVCTSGGDGGDGGDGGSPNGDGGPGGRGGQGGSVIVHYNGQPYTAYMLGNNEGQTGQQGKKVRS